jgi:hypothetical protein
VLFSDDEAGVITVAPDDRNNRSADPEAHRRHHEGPTASEKGNAQVMTFSDDEAGTITAVEGGNAEAGAPVVPDPLNHELAAQTFGHYADPAIGPANDDSESLAHRLVSDGTTTSEEHRPKEDAEGFKKEAGEEVSEAVEKGGEVTELEGAAGLGVRTAAQIARLPHVVALVKAHQYKEAIQYITGTLGFTDYVEVLKIVAEHLGLDFEAIAEQFPRAAKYVGAGLEGVEMGSLVLEGLEFQFEGLKAIAEAHERGERDNRIELYSEAWASGFLEGAYSNPGAVTEEQRKAVADGVREGKTSAGALGLSAADTAKKLLAQYGTEANARHALIDELLERAGVEGIKTHEGQ